MIGQFIQLLNFRGGIGQFLGLGQGLVVGAAAQERRQENARPGRGAKNHARRLPPQQRLVALPQQQDGQAKKQGVRQQERPERRAFGISCHPRKVRLKIGKCKAQF